MGAAAQLERVALYTDRPHPLPVLLVEEGVRPGGDGIGHRLDNGRDRAIVADDLADLVLDSALLVRGERPIKRIVESQVVRRHERAGLVRVRSDDVAQGPVQQVRSGVVAHRPSASLSVNAGSDRVADA